MRKARDNVLQDGQACWEAFFKWSTQELGLVQFDGGAGL